ncbi:BTB/POZ domain protein [Aspergillus taichungensis]|uniref:BTB/POZ domain protein n=1 Tax=Aspergillus taichungensis TaxID=482145 RepID=A0A2J5HIJ5_9EURO|nr:BTB/POZ domain protein [Aspergillus taichungensis]
MGNDEAMAVRLKTEGLEAEEKEGDLTASIQKYFHTSTFSDLTLVTSDQKFEMHKLIVCGQSGYFSRLFKHNWKEVTDNVIQLEEDDPRALEAMIHFMYGFSYDSSGSDRGRTSPMLFNVNVYQTGDKYDIPKLKEQAKEKFAVALKNCWEMDDFPVAIARAYSTTVASDRGLRDLIVDTCLEHISELLENDDFKQVLRETLDFAADLVHKQYYNSSITTYRCPNCTHEWGMKSSGAIYFCPSCSTRRDWNQFVVK